MVGHGGDQHTATHNGDWYNGFTFSVVRGHIKTLVAIEEAIRLKGEGAHILRWAYCSAGEPGNEGAISKTRLLCSHTVVKGGSQICLDRIDYSAYAWIAVNGIRHHTTQPQTGKLKEFSSVDSNGWRMYCYGTYCMVPFFSTKSCLTWWLVLQQYFQITQ